MTKGTIAIYGGTFDPFHVGHVYCIQTILEKTKTEKVYVVPNCQNPLKNEGDGPTPEQRLAMVEVGVSELDNVVVDAQEVERGGKSYTIDTVLNYRKEYGADQINLVIGLDQFYQLAQWKNYEKLLEECNFLVVSRPGNMLPMSVEDIPEALRKHVDVLDRTFLAFKSGRTLEFIRVKGIDVAATEIRKLLRTGRSVDKYLDMKVEDYIKEQSLYPLIGPKVGDYNEFTKFCADRLYNRKAVNLKGFNLSKMASPSDYAIIASGTSKRHSQALAEWLHKEVKNQYGLNPLSIEGAEEGRWVLVDYGQLIVHIFYDYVRTEYNLESLWRQGEDLKFTDPYADKP
ncbi:MAG: nicotinate (nicotinamide) nucleotide adenylyltransferase [Bdellovibrionaceae bacterium]|nr:nicotinate (nicotinamide) nucleotide adenylyltransferase [Pseudobdellovibrionaceae bacterium]